MREDMRLGGSSWIVEKAIYGFIVYNEFNDVNVNNN